MMTYFLCLGSNIGDRKKNLAQAISLMKKNAVQIIKRSAIYETSPIGIVEQPWFLNQVLQIQTVLEPRPLLLLLKKVEKKIGRTTGFPKGPRCIDIDILLAESRIVRSKVLIVPHPELANRNFVLLPLSEIAGDFRHPVLKETIEDLRRKSKDKSVVRLYEPA